VVKTERKCLLEGIGLDCKMILKWVLELLDGRL
jgi:hypothetical protein